MMRKLLDAAFVLAIVGLAAWNYVLQRDANRTWKQVVDLLVYSTSMRIEHDSAIGFAQSRIESNEISIGWLEKDIQSLGGSR